jgi:DNA-dependent metalloprotease WSS1
MPLNTLRLNHQKSAHPNDRVVFIKPLPRPPSDQASYDLADTFLRAIAAQCLPLMKKHYLSVTTLEEYEPNPEFIGRNFNNGEIIQLVLRTKDGRWVPFNAVQMVMMHELAHNTHMNHGRDFWKTRNLYADEMKALWARAYTGDGFWGGGRTLTEMGTVMGNNVLPSVELDSLPVCGGTFRSRKRKRRARSDKPELTWKEKRDRRIEKKFGKNGVALGEDEDKRLALEINRKGPIGVKPRVAQSARGRELRAAAALARFDTNKQEVYDLQQAESTPPEHSDDDYEDLDADQEDARDAAGRKILDGRGHGMIRVCNDGDAGGVDAQHELHDLNTLDRYFNLFQSPQATGDRAGDTVSPPADGTGPSTVAPTLESDMADNVQSLVATPSRKLPNFSSTPSPLETPVTTPRKLAALQIRKTPSVSSTSTNPPTGASATSTTPQRSSIGPPADSEPASDATVICQICSLENPSLNAVCMACLHVMDPQKDPRHWSCRSEACKSTGTAYVNAGDVNICGLCGVRRELLI